MHGVENILVHNMDLETELIAEYLEFVCEGAERYGAAADIDHHDHSEHILHDGLGDLQNIGTFICTNCGGLGQNTDHIFTDDGDYCFHNKSLSAQKRYTAIIRFIIHQTA